MTGSSVKVVRAKQIRGALERAIRLHIEGGKTLAESAEMAGMQDESLRKALAKPHVKEFCASVSSAWLAGRVAPAWHKVDRLIHHGESSKVALDTAKTLLGAAGQLMPDTNRGPSSAVNVQIVVAPSHTLPDVRAARGVVEAPAFNPATYRPALASPELVDVDDEG